MLMGVSRYAASEFSFLLAVPILMGATVLDLQLVIPDRSGYSDVRSGLMTAFVVALIAIKTFCN